MNNPLLPILRCMKQNRSLLIILALATAVQASLAEVLTHRNSYLSRIEQLGFSDESIDLSNSLQLQLEQPELAYVNLHSKYGIPYTKTSNFKDSIEYYDPATDTYFCKRVLVNVQGQTSTTFPKRNVTMDFCEDNWKCEEVPTLTFDGWVRQDGFHLKAFYTDWLRGVGIVGYQLFDEMEQLMPEDLNRIWKRAGVDGHKKARCYPDGFPCALYLNGEFYGVYVWQLKKHRRNMSMQKDCEAHIHLDGNLGEDNFWQGTIRWSSFEVRNPKGLLAADDTPYDGNAPLELGDGPVKDAIEALSLRCKELKTLRDAGADRSQIRQQMAQYFDVESMLNYLVFSTVVSNYDGFTKNWQWLTYDGLKWFVAPYDLDCTFGNFHAGTFVFPPEYSYVDSDHRLTLSRRGIATWFWDYYFDELCQRYAEVRDAGVFDAAHISALLHAWHDRIGTEVYEAEWPLWPDCMCVSQTITNDGWAEYDEWPDYYHVPAWKADLTFNAGDLCRLGDRIWLATATTTGVKPYQQMGYTDSLERFDQWISRRIELEDDFFGYQPSDLRAVEDPASDLLSAHAEAVYGIDGKRRDHLQQGINIVRYPDGNTKTIILR